MLVNAPIPGESLTGSPRKFPWERPPEMVDPEEVAEYYLEKLADPDILEPAMDMLESGMTIKDLTEGLIRLSISRGMHSIDVGLIVAPVVHQSLKSSADYLNVDYEEGLDDKEGREKRKMASRLLKARKMLDGIKGAPIEEDFDLGSEEPVMAEEEVEVEEEAPVEGAGFMQRRGAL